MKKPPPLDPESGNPLPAKYDPGDFIVAPSDARGVSYRLTFRVAPDLARAIDQIITSNRFPLMSRGDVLRFFVREGIRLIETLEPVISVSKRIDMLSTMLNEDKSHAEFTVIFDQLGEAVSRYLADQAPEQATRIIALAKHQFDMMPDGYWKKKYLVELAKRFPEQLDKAGKKPKGLTLPGGSLTDADEDEA